MVHQAVHPVVWPKNPFFYPIGNTTPSCFIRDLAPEISADILLLGCGDPRSILYTIYSDHCPPNRKLDFTCCDAEPAILARNILLFTMVADGESSLVIWSIFYHFFLDDASLGLLLAQCRKLVQISIDMETWRTSKYGEFLRFSTDQTLAEIRRHWVLYLEMKIMPVREKFLLENDFISGMRAVKSQYGQVYSAVNAAGPLAREIVELAPKLFGEFWSTGVTVGTSAQSKPCPHLNPTFVYSVSGAKFNVHYGTDPVVSFHLAPIFTSTKDTQRQSTISIKDLVEGARQQFFSLCSSLKSRLSLESSANLTIRFFVGDALAFCRALHYCGDGNIRETGIYTYPWGGSQIDFNVQDYSQSSTPRAPLTFNVIDTSNLTDHLGLINILVLTVPLLQKISASTIYTNTLFGTLTSDSDLVCKAHADIPTLSLILGVAPSPNLSLFTTHSDKHILLLPVTRFPQSISWKFPFSAIPGTAHDIRISNTTAQLVFDPKKLAEFLFSVYCNIFATDNMTELMKNPPLNPQLNPYTRNSFAALLGFVKAKAPTDWDQVMDFFMDFVESDVSTTSGMWLHHYQDLLCQLHLSNLFTAVPLRPTFVERLRRPQDLFHGWKDVPPVVCVVLKVPRRDIKILEDMDPGEILTPSLECRTSGPNFLNVYSSLQFVFGDIERSASEGETVVKILEDRKGWEGCSDLIVTFYVPSWTLLNCEPNSFRIGLHFACASTTVSLRAKLGSLLTIYSTTLTDTEHLQLVRERPGNVGELGRLRAITSVPISKKKNATEVWTTVGFDKSGEKASTLTMRHVITTQNTQKLLSNLASVTTKPVSDSVLEVTFDGNKHLFINPFPVRGSQCKTRIARKPFYIEVETPLRPDYENFHEMSSSPFPVSREGQLFNLLNIHYLNLNRLPAIKLPARQEKLEWISLHLGQMFSDKENIARENSRQQDCGSLISLKESIAAVFLRWVERISEDMKSRFHPLGLYIRTGGIGVYTLIFVNDIRLDLTSHTIVADACVIPLSQQNLGKLSSALERLSGFDWVMINTSDDETKLWKHLLPALAERCRTWKHLPTCEYLRQGIPAYMEGLKFEASPLCSCGKGKDLGTFGTRPEWKEFHSEATRIALSPLFSSPF